MTHMNSVPFLHDLPELVEHSSKNSHMVIKEVDSVAAFSEKPINFTRFAAWIQTVLTF